MKTTGITTTNSHISLIIHVKFYPYTKDTIGKLMPPDKKCDPRAECIMYTLNDSSALPLRFIHIFLS